MNPGGFGFVHPLEEDRENVFLPPEEARRALDQDRVRVVLVRKQGRTSGRIVKILGSVRRQVIGTYQDNGRRAWVVALERDLPEPVQVPRTQLARPGDLVKVQLERQAGTGKIGQRLTGEVSGSLGKPGDSSAEVLSIAYGKGFSDEFSAAVMAEAIAAPLKVAENEIAGRVDLRGMPLLTIDGEDARDFDDAVFAEPSGQGFRLIVAIADVTHYVRETSAVDGEALLRATSVYLPDRVLPMLPERYSNGICSLRPEEDRLCIVADLQIDHHGHTQQTRLYPAVMKSVARCTYGEVQDVLDGREVPGRTALRRHFELLQRLSVALREMRTRRGAIDFDLPELKVMLDAQGHPSRLDRRERQESHRLIEECMLAANEAVARYFQEQKLPSVYRFHGDPDKEKLAEFVELAAAHGFFLGRTTELSSQALNRFLKELEGHPQRKALNRLLLRSMMQAIYSAEEVGHYGLAAEHYLHFTSPIRRYPDLLVHRLLRAHWERKGRQRPGAVLDRETSELHRLATHCSERERAAIDVEREVSAYYSVLLMKNRIGETFPATVSSIADFGFFVELNQIYVEGLVRAEKLGRGHRLDEKHHALVYPSGLAFRLGDPLTVRLVGVSLERRQLDFDLVALAGAESRLPEPKRRRRRK